MKYEIIEKYIKEQMDKTGRHVLLYNLLNEWGCRVFNLTVGEVLNEFDLTYKDAHKHVVRYFKEYQLPLSMKSNGFNDKLFDYSIMLEE